MPRQSDLEPLRLTSNRETFDSNASGLDHDDRPTPELNGIKLRHLEQSREPIAAVHILIAAKEDDRRVAMATLREPVSENPHRVRRPHALRLSVAREFPDPPSKLARHHARALRRKKPANTFLDAAAEPHWSSSAPR